jgi:hypothetical protein
MRAQLEPDFDWSWAEDGPAWVSPAVDTRRPSVARCYDFTLGGKDNYEIDRDLAARIGEIIPDAAETARANREFVLRAVRLMAGAGVRQFLDLGCGIPAGVAVHEVVREVAPDARVAYVDHDPIVAAQLRAALDGQAGLYTGLHDLRDAARVLGDPALRQVLRFDEPVGVVLGAVLHHVDASLGVQVVSHYVGKLAPGSHVAVSVGSAEGTAPEDARALDEVLEPVTGPIVLRTRSQVEELLDGLDLLPPGIADVTRWQADAVPGRRMHAAVGVKPPRLAR